MNITGFTQGIIFNRNVSYYEPVRAYIGVIIDSDFPPPGERGPGIVIEADTVDEARELQEQILDMLNKALKKPDDKPPGVGTVGRW